jgi:UDP-N-acetylmuramoylalanine--D-glutamate ligase
MQNYVDSKMRIVQNQTENDVFIYWTGDPIVAKEIEKRNIKSKLCPFGLTNERNEKAFVKGDNLVLENLNLEIDKDIIAELLFLAQKGYLTLKKDRYSSRLIYCKGIT